MKIDFSPGDRTHAAVHPTQLEMRAATPKRYPIARTMLLLGLLVVCAVIAWRWLVVRRVYGYGVVATGYEVFHAPVRSRLERVQVEPGDRVSADTVLFVLVSDEARAELRASEESLAQEKRVLEVAISRRDALFEDPVQELRDMTTARRRADDLAREADALAVRQAEDRARRELDLARASADAARSQLLATDAATRLERVRRLRQLDAATADELQRAEGEHRLAALAAEQAAAERARRVAAAEAAVAGEAEELRLRREAVAAARGDEQSLVQSYKAATERRSLDHEKYIENVRSRIATIEARILNLKSLAGPTEVRALADGVITEVLVREGSNVPKDGMIMAMAGTGKVWINAYVPPDRARDVAVGGGVKIYPTTGGGPLPGKVTAGGGIQHKVHPSLGTLLTEPSAVYVRVDIEAPPDALIPGNVVKLVVE